MSALVQWFQHLGVRVSGSDRADSENISWLRDKGIEIVVEPSGATLPDGVHALIFSDAVPKEDPARRAAGGRGIPQYSYAEALGVLSAPYETVAISGSHGKSTTTALGTLMLEAGGFDPTAVIGTRVPALGNSNFRPGSGDIAIIEADEYRGHCLLVTPTVAVVTTTDYDHVDAFPTPESYRDVFRKFIGKTHPTGVVVLRASDPATPILAQGVAPRTLLTFDIAPPSLGNVTFRAPSPRLREGRQEFTVFREGGEYGTFTIPLPGDHLVLDALAALAAVSPWNIPVDVLQRTLAGFSGTWRRFEHVGVLDGVPVISDYAHHPTELRAVLQAVRQWYPNRRILLAFQPHQKARTKAFANEFLQVLRLPTPDVLVLSEVYDVSGREEAGDTTSTKDWIPLLRERGATVTYAPTLEVVEEQIRERVTPDDVVLLAGAGTIDRVARRLVVSA